MRSALNLVNSRIQRDKKAGSRRLFYLLLRLNYRPLMKPMISAMSASLTFGLAGIGIEPQAPEPPFLTFSATLAYAAASPLYLSATAFQAGPTTFLSTAWQAVQLFFLATAGISVAIAEPATIRPAATIMLVTIDFIFSPFLGLTSFTTSGVLTPAAF